MNVPCFIETNNFSNPPACNRRRGMRGTHLSQLYETKEYILSNIKKDFDIMVQNINITKKPIKACTALDYAFS